MVDDVALIEPVFGMIFAVQLLTNRLLFLGRERERERKRERETETETETDRQTDRQKQKKRDREKERVERERKHIIWQKLSSESSCFLNMPAFLCKPGST